MAERLANIGYLGLKVESTPGTAVTPSDFIPLYSESMTTNLNLVEDDPIVGLPWKTYQTVQGQRDHQGKVTVLAEPNTSARLFDMLMTKGTGVVTYSFTVTSANATVGATYTNNGVTFTVTSTIVAQTTLVATSSTGAPTTTGTLTKASGTGDATITFSANTNTTSTWPFTSGVAANSYTVDISTGNQVFRFCGVGAEMITHNYQGGNEMQYDVDLSALTSFTSRTLASTPTGTNPYTVVFDTQYDPNPTNGLVVGDTMQIYAVSGGAITSFTIASITNGTTITTTTNLTGNATGDIVTIKPQTPTFNNLTPFLWSRTQFCFGATASAALSASHTPLETGSAWSITHAFENKAGAKRSGSFDPASLPRIQYSAGFKAKKFFDNPVDEATWANLTKTACVIRHYSGSGQELRVTLNNIKNKKVKPDLKSNSILYSEEDFVVQYDLTDAQACDVKVINQVATV